MHTYRIHTLLYQIIADADGPVQRKVVTLAVVAAVGMDKYLHTATGMLAHKSHHVVQLASRQWHET